MEEREEGKGRNDKVSSSSSKDGATVGSGDGTAFVQRQAAVRVQGRAAALPRCRQGNGGGCC